MFTPLNNRLLVRPDPKETQTESGILIATDKEERPATGTVLQGTPAIPPDVRIAFSAYGYDEVTVDREKLYVVSESSVLGIF